MIPNLTLTDGGTIPTGTYGHIEARGNVCMEPGVRFRTMNIDGDLVGSDMIGSSLHLNGSLHLPTGSLRVFNLHGRGRVLGQGDIYADCIDIEGLINTEGRIIAKRYLKFCGLMEGQTNIVSRDVSILGVIHVETLLASHVRIETMHPKVVPLKDVKWMVRHSEIGTLICHYAELHKCGCNLVQSNIINLREGTFVYDAVCTDTITTDKKSAAVMTLGGAKRLHVAGY
ncbi:hypothetical protein KIMH_09800 [Bombiscardovia apis]|uniref:Uncharacterized protein n=1 Tax=Bombiscardovia apis TaxID=2932182 RepID=A0ABN6SFT8_9BIFI|nr:hypothetical protein [Bombiscardovia apis]BDR54869.1 hypothetical protein KIMH_09800 [Bombiscardovia apis]